MTRRALLTVLILAFAWKGFSAPDQPPVGEVADRILDSALPSGEREKTIDQHPDLAADLITEMASRIAPDGANEYDLIPWIWRVAHRAGKRNDTALVRRIMEVSMPAGPEEPLRDWQCVVLGGGVVMGLAETQTWPGPRVQELLRGQPEAFARRWELSLELAIRMSHEASVPPPTRYDALRMLCVLPFERAEPHLTRYLAPGTEEEIQLGAIHGLLDMNDDRIAQPLIDQLNGLPKKNQGIAVKGLVRTPARALALLDAVAQGKVAREAINSFRERELREHADETVRRRASEVLGGGKP